MQDFSTYSTTVQYNSFRLQRQALCIISGYAPDLPNEVANFN